MMKIQDEIIKFLTHPLTDEELKTIKLPTEQEIEEALQKGKREADAFLENAHCLPGFYR